jgi:hypothetical protein
VRFVRTARRYRKIQIQAGRLLGDLQHPGLLARDDPIDSDGSSVLCGHGSSVIHTPRRVGELISYRNERKYSTAGSRKAGRS